MSGKKAAGTTSGMNSNKDASQAGPSGTSSKKDHEKSRKEAGMNGSSKEVKVTFGRVDAEPAAMEFQPSLAVTSEQEWKAQFKAKTREYFDRMATLYPDNPWWWMDEEDLDDYVELKNKERLEWAAFHNNLVPVAAGLPKDANGNEEPAGGEAQGGGQVKPGNSCLPKNKGGKSKGQKKK